jgi:hypothetical protein
MKAKQKQLPKVQFGTYESKHDGLIKVDAVDSETCRFTYLERKKPPITTTIKHLELMVWYGSFELKN